MKCFQQPVLFCFFFFFSPHLPIQAGLAADIVVLADDPAADVTALGSIVMVMKGGQFFSRPFVV